MIYFSPGLQEGRIHSFTGRRKSDKTVKNSNLININVHNIVSHRFFFFHDTPLHPAADAGNDGTKDRRCRFRLASVLSQHFGGVGVCVPEVWLMD